MPVDVKSNEDLSHEERERLGHEVKACPQLALAHLHQCKEKKNIYIYIYGSPPPGPTSGGGECITTKCGVEYIKRHAQKTL